VFSSHLAKFEATQIVTKIAGDSTQGARTWALLTEAADGGWGIAGTAFGREEFAALASESSTPAATASAGVDAASSIPGFVNCDYFDLSVVTLPSPKRERASEAIAQI
jgi:hypothetical protein